MGFIVSVDGCPYAFASSSVTGTVTSTDVNWSSDWTLVQHALDWEASNLDWEETLEPIDGRLTVGPLTFRIRDLPMSSGVASGYNLMTWLATRKPQSIVSSPLTGTLAIGAGSFTVNDGSSFPSGSQAVYIEGEALGVFRSGSTFTVVTRGLYGSRQVAHVVDPDSVTAPEVWASFPWITRRRVVLWDVDDANVAHVLWIGYANRSPRLCSNGMDYEIQADHFWTVESQRTWVAVSAQTKLRGFSGRGIDVFPTGSVGGTPLFYTPNQTSPAPFSLVYRTFPDAFSGAMERTASWLAGLSGPPTDDIAPTYQNGGMIVESGTTGIDRPGLKVTIGNRVEYGNPVRDATDPKIVTLEVNDLPRALIGSNVDQYLPIPVTTVAGMPSSWASSTHTDEGGTVATTIAPVLRGDYNDQYWVVLEVDSTTGAVADDTSITTHGPTITAKISAPSKTPGQYGLDDFARASSLGLLYIDTDVTLRYTAHVTSDQWVYALKYALSDSTVFASGVDPRNFDWSNISEVVAAMDTRITGKDFYFDSTQQIGKTIVNLCRLHGCGLGIRGGRIAILPYRAPLANESTVTTLTQQNFANGLLPQYTQLPDGIANVCQVTAENVTLKVRDAYSCGRYGESRTIELSLEGIPITDQQLLDNFNDFTNTILSRVLTPWNEQVDLVRVPLSIDYRLDVYAFDYVLLSEFMLPRGDGTRGLSNAIGMVLRRNVSFRDAVVWLDIIILSRVAGYSPTIRVASISGKVLTAAQLYVAGTDDYAGTVAAGETGRGVKKFAVGDYVQLVQRDTTTPLTPFLSTIDAISGNTITLHDTPPLGWTTTIESLGTVDLTYGTYGSIQAGQKLYAWCGSINSPNKIAGTTDLASPWA